MVKESLIQEAEDGKRIPRPASLEVEIVDADGADDPRAADRFRLGPGIAVVLASVNGPPSMTVGAGRMPGMPKPPGIATLSRPSW